MPGNLTIALHTGK